MSHLSILLFAATLILIAEDEIPKQNPYTAETDVARGNQLFKGQCSRCHGPAGEGGRGANLARATLPRATDDPSLFRVIRDGLQNTEMPGSYAMTDHEMWQVAAFVRTLGRAASEKVPGDPERGRSLVNGKGGCQRCHTIHGAGGVVGPELTEIGARRSASFIRGTLLDPATTLPEAFAMVQVETKQSRRLSGIRLNEDTYSIQFRDLSGNVHSFWKEDLSEFHKDFAKSPMPSFRTVFSGSELTDVVAYLVSLRGEL
jgi:putative heme-binding domain-containing protein